MGLDITAYSKVTLLDVSFDQEKYTATDNKTQQEVDFDVVPFVNPDFPKQAEGIVDRGVYKAEKNYSFRAGSYSGYSIWREELSKLAGYEKSIADRWGTPVARHTHGAWLSKESDSPFLELICFSDCEGVIGSEVSKKLLKDFSDFKHIVDEMSDDSYFKRVYNNFHEAFRLASNDGMVEFH